ncbi:DUF3592 domain-containing protein [Mucilaginibacter sp. PAMB04168]|uniref:DUF3592 domain-containing protein n=1 Tax=Mucilaginibacter sp. PAMB04168 TaxID=3138567 RepID=UPI0031F6B8CE
MNKWDRIFSLLALVAGLGIIVLIITDNNKNNYLKKTGAKTTATVVRTLVVFNKTKSRTHDSFKDKSIYGIYQFKATNGQTYEVQATTSGAHIGEKTIIYYDPANPQLTYYLDSDAYGFFLGLGIGSIMIILGVVFYKKASR